MSTKYLLNPFIWYVISFGLALFVYSWGWSDMYPRLTFSVFIFLTATFLVAVLLSRKIQKKITHNRFKESSYNVQIVTMVVGGNIVEYIYNKGIPLFTLLRGGGIDYMDFGIPTFHVFLLTFANFYATYLFAQFLDVKKFKPLFLFFILLLTDILLVNRGATIMCLTSCLVLFLYKIRSVSVKTIITLFVLVTLFFYGFGYLGNQRSFNSDPYAFLRLTQANDSFLESDVPKEFYWFYIYASSPLANFQNSVITVKKHNYDVLTFIAWELMPDFLSKRLVSAENDTDGSNRLDYSINPILTVGTTYFEPYIRLGWIGPTIIFAFMSFFTYLYIKLFTHNSKYLKLALSIWCVVSIFSVFENMINFTGLIFQLIYPVLFSLIEKKTIKFVPSKRVRFIIN